MSDSAFVRQLAEEVEGQQLFPRNARMVVGVSGGADSMVLLHALLGLNALCDYRLDLHIAHLNHSFRAAESDEDAAFVEAVADGLNLPRTVERCDVPARCEAQRGSAEEIARQTRYAFLERVCVSIHARWIAVGHHADDNAETVLHRIIRGTGLRGMGGIASSRAIRRGSAIRIVRPLLRVNRSRLRRYLAEEGLVHREDPSNAVLDRTRNKIRHALLPRLETEYNPQVREALLRLAEQARWADDYIRATVHRVIESMVISRTDQELVLNAHALSRKDRIVQTELVRAAIASFEIGEQDLTFGHLKAVTDLLDDEGSGRRVSLPRGMSAQRVYKRLILSMPTDQPREDLAENIAVRVPGPTVLPVRNIQIECDLFRVGEADVAGGRPHCDPREEWLDADNVHLPLVVRSRQPGDRFWPLGAPGSKKLSDFLSDLKVDPADRERVAVLCDQLGPVWIIGYRIDERVKLSRITREVLRVRARSLKD